MSKKNRRLNEWLRKHNVDRIHVCRCGCGKQIIATERHYRNKFKIPKFLPGHNFKDKSIPRSKKASRNLWDSLSEEEKQRRLNNLQKFKAREDNPNWGGGRFKNTSGYMLVLDPDHPFAVNGYVLEHRLVVENWLRTNESESPHLTEINGEMYLKPGRVVHHIDEVRDNNDLSNLYVFECNAAHIFFHKSMLPIAEKLRIIESGKFKIDEE